MSNPERILVPLVISIVVMVTTGYCLARLESHPLAFTKLGDGGAAIQSDLGAVYGRLAYFMLTVGWVDAGIRGPQLAESGVITIWPDTGERFVSGVDVSPGMTIYGTDDLLCSSGWFTFGDGSRQCSAAHDPDAGLSPRVLDSPPTQIPTLTAFLGGSATAGLLVVAGIGAIELRRRRNARRYGDRPVTREGDPVDWKPGR